MNTGRIFIRGTNKEINGKKVYIVAGVVAFDSEVETEKLYTVLGIDDLLSFNNPQNPPIDVSGMRIDQVLTSKIWSV